MPVELTARPIVIVIMGVSGSGKTTVGRALARAMGWRYFEGDRFHSRANIEKMSSGRPLTDRDRWPWLRRIRGVIERQLATGEPAIVSCSALKRSYRAVLRPRGERGRIAIVYLRGSRELLAGRLRRRRHFMPARMLASQFRALQEPRPGEAVTVEADRPIPSIVREVRGRLGL